MLRLFHRAVERSNEVIFKLYVGVFLLMRERIYFSCVFTPSHQREEACLMGQVLGSCEPGFTSESRNAWREHSAPAPHVWRSQWPRWTSSCSQLWAVLNVGSAGNSTSMAVLIVMVQAPSWEVGGSILPCVSESLATLIPNWLTICRWDGKDGSRAWKDRMYYSGIMAGSTSKTSSWKICEHSKVCRWAVGLLFMHLHFLPSSTAFQKGPDASHLYFKGNSGSCTLCPQWICVWNSVLIMETQCLLQKQSFSCVLKRFHWEKSGERFSNVCDILPPRFPFLLHKWKTCPSTALGTWPSSWHSSWDIFKAFIKTCLCS